MAFSNLRWNYSPLKEKAVRCRTVFSFLPVAALQTAKGHRFGGNSGAPDARGSAASGPRREISLSKLLSLRSTPPESLAPAQIFMLLHQAARRASRPRGES